MDRHVKHILQEEEAYKAVARDSLREEWYDRWRDSAGEQYRKQKQQEKDEAIQKFEKLLRESEMVKTDSVWENLENDLPFMRESWVTLLSSRQCRKVRLVFFFCFLKCTQIYTYIYIYLYMHIYVYVQIFENIQDEVVEKEEQKLKAIKEQKRQAEREQRTQFKELLNELSEKQLLHCNSEWTKIVGLLENDPRYKVMQEQQSTKIKHVFATHLEQIKEKIKDDRNKFKKWLKQMGEKKNQKKQLNSGIALDNKC
ncbi:hypothetical protein RFI_11231 [Reticulomyxa filosa]|uniref:FF domain-containing protein n=1 Tax=Reticulomyxa filosa TaxID=46433 RepID=X6NJ45_RETFI|nr:hypothetical protein RFI_11231 [Reticulomyxa filosa]|eukprot:ETO25908.1 hypothetical protein RFI_11231 [Reticulomyxa filosa]